MTLAAFDLLTCIVSRFPPAFSGLDALAVDDPCAWARFLPLYIKLGKRLNATIRQLGYTPGPAEAEFDDLTAGSGTIQLCA